MYCIDCYTRLNRAKDGRCPACGCAFDRTDPASYAHETNTLKMRVIARTAGLVVFVLSFALFAYMQRAVIETTYGARFIHIGTDFQAGLITPPDAIETSRDYYLTTVRAGESSAAEHWQPGTAVVNEAMIEPPVAVVETSTPAGMIRWTLAAPPADANFDAAYLPPASGMLILIQLLALAALAYKFATTAHRRTLFWLEAEAELNSTVQAAGQLPARGR